MLPIILRLCFYALFLFLWNTVSAQQVRYNRIQHKNYKWYVLPVKDATVYFPEQHDSLAVFTTRWIEPIKKEVSVLMGKTTSKVPNIIIYPSGSRMYESNAGMYQDGLLPFPTIVAKGERILVPFNGNHEEFINYLRRSWILMSWEELFKSEERQDVPVHRKLFPDGFKEAAIDHISEGWTLENEMELHQIWTNAQTGNWQSISAAKPQLVWHSFIYFLEEKYDYHALNFLLTQFRQKKSLERGVRLVFKRTLDTLTNECFRFWQNRWNTPVIHTSDTVNEQTAWALQSFDGKTSVFIAEKKNKRKVFINNHIPDKKPKLLFSYTLPPWLNDLSHDHYPVLQWSKDGKNLFAVYPQKGKMIVRSFNLSGQETAKKEVDKAEGIDGFMEMKANEWLMSAYRNGQSDLVKFNPLRNSFEALTTDKADNTELIKDKEGNLYYRSGYPAVDSADSTGKPYGLYQWKDGNEALVRQDNDGIKAFLYDSIQPQEFYLAWTESHNKRKSKRDSIAELIRELKLKDKDSSAFLMGILQPKQPKDSNTVNEPKDYPKAIRPYLLQLYNGWFSARLNNDYYINKYQPFASHLGTFKVPETGVMATGGFSDIFDNHHFNIGYRMPSGMKGSDFFVRYENTAKKTDWNISFFRKVENLPPNSTGDWKDKNGFPYPALAKVKTRYYSIGWKRPLDYEWALSLQLSIRDDKTYFPALDLYSLDFAPVKQWWSINTINLAANKLQETAIPMLYSGWEGNAGVDIMAATGKDGAFTFGTMLQWKGHLPIYKGINLSTGVQGGYSGGGKYILYNMGGMENNITPLYDTSVHFAQHAPYSFQTLIMPFRGYMQNSLYGRAFGLMNVDVYVPLFAELIPLKTGFSVVRNFQIGLFTDWGTALLPNGTGSYKYSFGFSARTLLAGYPIRFDIGWPENFSKIPVWYLSIGI